MNRILPIALMACVAAQAAGVLFTTRNAWESPALVSEPAASKEFGFQSVLIRNTSQKTIDAVYLQIVFHGPGMVDEEVDSARIRVGLRPGDAKRFDVYLGHLQGLQQKAATLRGDSIAAVLSIRGADFANGTTWHVTRETAPVDSPRKPAK